MRPVVIGGPTATGKSDLALDLAEALDGEVVNADSMQLYRGMDIGTAKLPVAERRGLPHHLLDVLDVTEPASVATYQQQARTAIEEILGRGRTPVLVGGSGLYIGAVIDEIEFPGTDPAVRAALEAELAAVGPAELHHRLAALDPAAAAAIDPGNGRRLVRALEVVQVTGRPFTAVLPRPGAPRYGALMVLLDRPTAELDERIGRRVRQMVDLGLLDEVVRLDAVGLRTGLTASRALGYRQMLDVIDGAMTMEAAIDATAAGTRRFVRRQRSWFGRDSRWHRYTPGSATAGDVLGLLRSGAA
ncbi:tRNA (adenosine(37)-N6)-dimethylallyltransferase MiaA [Nakamurella sp. YIM 132087]|uniref:tRNA dimethylallyltransferase n=1 Tax=Nakamurella alba TaxID=2665158 RepID=A0A7K1FUN9_9ACTN|nr:tRNA (adenosine(37)-N6)-dimethylallyltransferase MiaA [Nakamurella alba]